MKKIVFAVIFTLFAFVGYSQQYVMTSKGYTVNGQVIKGSGYATLRVYLPDGNERLDSTVLDDKGKFFKDLFKLKRKKKLYVVK